MLAALTQRPGYLLRGGSRSQGGCDASTRLSRALVTPVVFPLGSDCSCWTGLEQLCGSGPCPQHLFAAGQRAWLRQSAQRGPTGRQVCWPKPTRSQLISLQRSLQDETGEGVEGSCSTAEQPTRVQCGPLPPHFPLPAPQPWLRRLSLGKRSFRRGLQHAQGSPRAGTGRLCLTTLA